MKRLARLSLAALVGTAAFASCAKAPEADPGSQAAQRLPVRPGWLEGKAQFHRSLAAPTFGVSVRLRGSDFPAIDTALGVNNPCFSLAFVQKCSNGVSAPARPNLSLVSRGRATTLDVPIWCPSVGTAFAWSAEFTDYRRIVGHPGTQFQPLMRCEGLASGAVFLFPSGLRSEASTLARPGIPLEGLQLTDWVTL
jgi:hypothetical protein